MCESFLCTVYDCNLCYSREDTQLNDTEKKSFMQAINLPIFQVQGYMYTNEVFFILPAKSMFQGMSGRAIKQTISVGCHMATYSMLLLWYKAAAEDGVSTVVMQMAHM